MVYTFAKAQGGSVGTVQIAPEDEPINSSPWYAFRLASPVQVTVPIVLDYGTHKHRYTPDISIDGVAWQTYPSDRVSLSINSLLFNFNEVYLRLIKS